MKYVICFLLFLKVAGQNFQVVDNKGNPVSYANLLFYNSNTITKADFTDKDGYYKWTDTIHFNELSVTCIGYDSLRIKKEALQNVIVLVQKPFILDEIVVTKNTKTKTYGFLDRKPVVKIGVGKGIEVVLFIENKDKIEQFIKTGLFTIHKLKGVKATLRLHFYSKAVTGPFPNHELQKQDILYHLDGDEFSGLLKLDVSAHNIIFPKEGFFVGVECVEKTPNDTGTPVKIGYNDSHINSYTFIRNRTNGIWSNESDNLSKVIPMIRKKVNASFGIEVYD